MKLLEKILVPVDINSDYEEQINVAIELADSFNSEVMLTYVLSVEKLHSDIKKIVIEGINNSLIKIKKTFTDKGIRVKEPVIEYGKPVEKILQMAVAENVNLILTGSGNKDKQEKYQLGINAEKLISLSDQPVWVVKSNEKTKLKNILCPVDFSAPSKRALKNAILMSKRFHSSLRILGVYEPFSTNSLRIKIDEEKENAILLKQFEQQMAQFLKEFDLSDVNHIIDIQAGSAHERILNTINEFDHDLLFIGTNGRTGLNRLLMGSITEKVIREMPCSFVTTKTRDIIQVKFDNEIKEIEIHYNNANELVESGLYKDAIDQFMICLQINDMHIPSMYKLAELYSKLGDNPKANYYDNMAKELLARLWDKKIEQDIRKHYRSVL